MDRGEKPRVGIIVSPYSLRSIAILLAALERENVSVMLMALRESGNYRYALPLLGNVEKKVTRPLIPLNDIPPNSQYSVTVDHLAASIGDVMERHRLAELIVDLTEMAAAIEAAWTIGVAPYLYSNSSMTTLCKYFNVPVETPGSIPQRGTDVPHPFQNPSTDRNEGFPRDLGQRFRAPKGILVNSFSDLEPDPTRALKSPALPPVYPVGPIIPDRGVFYSQPRQWLGKWEPGSVLFVLLGPSAMRDKKQIRELAMALERSTHRFLWVVEEFDDNVNKAFQQRLRDYAFILKPLDRQIEFLADTSIGGFLTYCGQFLAHESIGGFLTDCEWPAVMQSIAHGVPLIALPVSDEQKMNAAMLTKVSLRPNADNNGLVFRDEICNTIDVLMGDEDKRMKEVRDQMQMLKDSAARALTEEGSSYKALAHVAKQWKSKGAYPL